MDIKIIHEDDELLIIDKPAGITVNKSETTANQDTIQEWAEEKLKVKSENLPAGKAGLKVEIESDFYSRGGIVHRLDKETSGILIIAKNVSAFDNIQKQFKERVVKKTYLSLAHGEIKPDTGEINAPVGRLPWSRKQFGIFPGGRESITNYKTVSYFNHIVAKEKLTLVELYPKSGRTHQIRVHLKYIGHPVFSDFLYAGRKTARKDRKLLPRVFLHAAKIFFTHPTTGESVNYESELPSELSDLLGKFEKI